MSIRTNELGQPIGAAVDGWTIPVRPSREPSSGTYCRLEPLADAHAEPLFEANRADQAGRMWTYLAYGPFDTLESYRRWVSRMSQTDDPLFFTVIEIATGLARGVASYLRIDPPAGTIEVGHIAYAPALQRSRSATEAMYLMMQRVFALGYRRYEWKCDALNAASRAAAQRLGFSYEGIFRQATVYKDRNRDTAWYAVVDSEWPRLDEAFRRWLDARNFDDQGRQRVRLSELTAPIVVKRG
ncbi:MAG TPA: GNAT family protein [Vicinamibacterales bacterium]